MKHKERDFNRKRFFHFYMMITGAIYFFVNMFRGEKMLLECGKGLAKGLCEYGQAEIDERKSNVLEITKIDKNEKKKVWNIRNKKRLPYMTLEVCRGSPKNSVL